jgi:hypothetical protein
MTKKSFVENRGEGVTPQIIVRPDELGDIDADEAAARLAARATGEGRKRGWPKGKPRGRKTKLAVLGIPSGVLAAGNQDYARCVRLASAYRKVRVRELTVNFGYVSSGASALLASAAHALAASRYLYQAAATASGPDVLELLKSGAKLSDSARQNELAAWELAKREGEARKRLAAFNQGMPWMVPVEDQRKPGPKKKAEGLPPVGTDLTVWVQSAKLDEEDSNDAGTGSGTEGTPSSGQE